MGSGSTAYRMASGQYQALTEQLWAEAEIERTQKKLLGELELEQARQAKELELELAQKHYELIKQNKLPRLQDQLTGDTQPRVAAVPAETTMPAMAVDYKKLLVPAIIVGYFLLKERK